MKKKKNVEVLWRGYKDVVIPEDPKFTTEILTKRLVTALGKILTLNRMKSFKKSEEIVSPLSVNQI